jgi:P4 family phage/plasmid primase-like protien
MDVKTHFAELTTLNILTSVLDRTQHDIELRALPSMRRIFSRKIQKLIAFINDNFGENLFFGVCTREGGGRKEHVREAVCFFADLDFKKYQGGESEAWERLNAFQYKPTFIIHSGNGIHAYWFLRDAVEPSKKIESILRGIAQNLKSDMAICELARVMRIPGTFNYKNGDKKECRIIAHNPEELYNLDDFLKFADGQSKHTRGNGDNSSSLMEVVDEINKKCDFCKYCYETSQNLSEPLWFAMLSNLCRYNFRPVDLCHAYSQNYPQYTPHETEQKIRHALNDTGPHTCQYIKQTGFDCGKNCGVTAPIVLLNKNTERKRTIVLSKFRPRPFTDEIKNENHFVWEGKRGALWRYNKNKKLWMPDGEAFIESYFRDATANLDDAQKQRNVIAEIVADVAGSSYQEDGLPKTSINLIPFLNGIYDLNSDSFRDTRPDDYFTWALPWRYNPKAHSTFLKGLIDSTMPDPETLYELLAYALWRGYPYQKFWLLVGPGSNGKGVYLTIFTRLLGSENISCVSLREIQNSNFAAGTLHRKLANLSGEVDYSGLNNTGLLKQLTGGDQIQGDRKYLSPVRFVNHAKLIFATNQVPVTRDCTDAFYRRAFLVEFPKTFKADPTIDVKLREESERMTEEFEGFLFEIVQRLRELIKSGFIFTQDKDTETIRARYDALSNPLRRFVTENCGQTFSGDDYIYKFEFRERLNAWLLERRFNAYTDERIKREMLSLGHEDGQRGEKKYRSWVGLQWSQSRTSRTSQGFINHSYTHKNQFIKGCELREPCDSDNETDGILTVTELSS